MKKIERAPKPSPKREGESEGETSELLDMDEIKELVELVAEKDITDFELVRGRFKLRLRRGNAGADPVLMTSHTVGSPGSDEVSDDLQSSIPGAQVSSDASSLTGTTEKEVPGPGENLHVITSPIVGTYFRATSPTAEPFVKQGDSIVPGQTLCIIEAMKLMNEIQSEVTGVIERIFVENGQPVEYGQPLFGVKL